MEATGLDNSEGNKGLKTLGIAVPKDKEEQHLLRGKVFRTYLEPKVF